MPLVPIAVFLAGALLSILLPTLLLIALVVWYWKFTERVPATREADVPPAPAEAGASGTGNPGSTAGNPGSTAGNPGSTPGNPGSTAASGPSSPAGER